MDWFEGFSAARHAGAGATLHARTGGRRDGPPLLLLHGFPQTHVMWHRVAQRLADEFFLVMPDLRGYGDSERPVPGDGGDHVWSSKRAMAADMDALMRGLGHERYFVCGHDRGGRVAHRLALDHPQAVRRLVLLDIAPTLDMYAATDMAFASAYYHWFHLIQPWPLPEHMIEGCALEYLQAKLGRWGAQGLAHQEPQAARTSTAPARTTGPARASTSNTTAPRAPRASASPATCMWCGAGAAWCTACSTRWCCGARSARGP